TPAICTECSNGCNVWFDHRSGKFSRLNARTNEAVNEEWTCDKGKFGHDWYNSDDRAKKVMVRNGEQFEEATWSDAYAAIIDAFTVGKDKKGGKGAGLIKPTVSNEALYLFKKLLAGPLRAQHIDHRWTTGLADLAGAVSSSIESLEHKRSILLFGTDLAAELPIVFLRVRKAWFLNGAKVVVAHTGPTDADSFAHVVLRYKEGTARALARGLASLIAGNGDAQAIATETGVPADKLTTAAESLKEDPAIITTHRLLDQQFGADAIPALSGVEGEFNCYALDSNGQGALELDIATGRSTRQILEAAAEGSIKALWLVGCDPLKDFPDRDLAQRALENIEFLVVQNVLDTEAAHYASVLLPMAAPAEQDGTYTSCERRVQRMRQAIGAPGQAKPAWRIFTECLVRAEPQTPSFNPSEIMADIANEHAAFEAAKYDRLDGEGVLLGPAKTGVSPQVK
ncbi:MAG: molybdopterin-dependent oxidoreductase, partial [Armatimonadetes bacterium]|nr:molybdopterin-dependent oxidoreductase [Armatimonadota bacterium]